MEDCPLRGKGNLLLIFQGKKTWLPGTAGLPRMRGRGNLRATATIPTRHLHVSDALACIVLAACRSRQWALQSNKRSER